MTISWSKSASPPAILAGCGANSHRTTSAHLPRRRRTPLRPRRNVVRRRHDCRASARRRQPPLVASATPMVCGREDVPLRLLAATAGSGELLLRLREVASAGAHRDRLLLHLVVD